MKPKVIKTRADYAAALMRVEELMDARPNTSEGDELELLSLLVHSHEAKVFPINKPGPVDCFDALLDRSSKEVLASVTCIPQNGWT